MTEKLFAGAQPSVHCFIVVPSSQKFLHAYKVPSCLPTQFAVTLSMYTLILAVYRALLKSAVSGIVFGFIPLRKCVKAGLHKHLPVYREPGMQISQTLTRKIHKIL